MTFEEFISKISKKIPIEHCYQAPHSGYLLWSIKCSEGELKRMIICQKDYFGININVGLSNGDLVYSFHMAHNWMQEYSEEIEKNYLSDYLIEYYRRIENHE